jgi:hypothetical protein
VEPRRHLAEQILELIGYIVTGMVAGAVSRQLVALVVFDQALGLSFLDDPPYFTAVRIVFNADAHVAETFPVHEDEALVGEFAGLLEDELGFGEADLGIAVRSFHGRFNLRG